MIGMRSKIGNIPHPTYAIIPRVTTPIARTRMMTDVKLFGIIIIIIIIIVIIIIIITSFYLNTIKGVKAK